MPKFIIYIAEDQPLHVELMRAALQGQENYELNFFSDGLELYRKVLEKPPNLLILDILLPSLSGLAISRLLKFHDDYRHIPILIVSSITEPDIQEKALNVGADLFLAKPYKIEDLLKRINTLLHPD
jgi:DNA-binding response OmpR family regulator